jgi:hypothetical protein
MVAKTFIILLIIGVFAMALILAWFIPRLYEVPNIGPLETEIDSCTTIRKPGTYKLIQDILSKEAGSCIRIVEVDGVTLDGNGYTVSGSGMGTGVYIAGELYKDRAENNIVKDLTVRNFHYGITIQYAEHNKIKNCNIFTDTLGIKLGHYSHYNIITDSTICSAGIDVYFEYSDENSGSNTCDEIENINNMGNPDFYCYWSCEV